MAPTELFVCARSLRMPPKKRVKHSKAKGSQGEHPQIKPNGSDRGVSGVPPPPRPPRPPKKSRGPPPPPLVSEWLDAALASGSSSPAAKRRDSKPNPHSPPGPAGSSSMGPPPPRPPLRPPPRPPPRRSRLQSTQEQRIEAERLEAAAAEAAANEGVRLATAEPGAESPLVNLGGLAASLVAAAATPSTSEAPKHAPRTTRHSEWRDLDGRFKATLLTTEAREAAQTRHSEGQRVRRAREREQKAAAAALLHQLQTGRLRAWQLLMIEYVLLPANYGKSWGQLRTGFLDQYKRSRQTTPQGKMKLESLPQEELRSMSDLQVALLSDGALVAAASERIREAKEDYLEDMQELGVLGKFVAKPFESFMSIRTRSHEVTRAGVEPRMEPIMDTVPI